MKKYFLQAMLLLISSVAIAQDTDEDNKAFNIGYWIGKNILWIILGIVLLILLIRMMKKKK